MQSQELAAFDRMDQPRDECGIIAVVVPGGGAAEIACAGISELDNRGKEATGVAIMSPGSPNDGEGIIVVKGFGIGKRVFPDGGAALDAAYPDAISSQGQARYSTQGTAELSGAQPHGFKLFVEGYGTYEYSHIQNGNLTNTNDLRDKIGRNHQEFSSDSEVAGSAFGVAIEEQLLKDPHSPVDLKRAVLETLPMFEGAFTGSIMTREQTIVYTDHHGIKPAVIGILRRGGVVVASEVPALDRVEASLVREMEAGEIVTIYNDGSWEAEQWALPEPKGCLIEVFYFMHTHGMNGTKAVFRGVEIEAARRRAGEVLAQTTPAVDSDLVFGIPKSAVLAGQGYAAQSGVPHSETAVTIRDRHKGTRSFIMPTQEERRSVVRSKLEFHPQEVAGKDGLAVEDSLIRGTTMKEVADMFKEAGGNELHVRIAFALVKHICDLGIDLGTPMELLANQFSNLEEMASYLHIKSIAFLEVKAILEDVLEVVSEGAKDRFCDGCLTGNYPSKTPTLIHPYYEQN